MPGKHIEKTICLQLGSLKNFAAPNFPMKDLLKETGADIKESAIQAPSRFDPAGQRTAFHDRDDVGSARLCGQQ